MAGKVLLLLFSFILLIIGSNATGQMLILHSPYSLQFKGTTGSRTRQSFIKEIFSASLGLSVGQNLNWDGLAIVDPFSTPEAVVEVYVEGFSAIDLPIMSKVPKIPLSVDAYEPDTFDVLRHRINQRYTDGENIIVNLDLSDPEHECKIPFSDLSVGKVEKHAKQQYLDPSVEEDYAFLSEIEVLKAITEKINSGAIKPDNNIDFYFFRVRSMHQLADFHGPRSLQTKEAKQILAEALQDLTYAFSKAYEGSVLVSLVSTDVAHTRRATREAHMDISELKDGYSADYASIFNIIMWFTVVFVFSMIAIVYAIMDMDPGRDSIIYRMTNTRMKKE